MSRFPLAVLAIGSFALLASFAAVRPDPASPPQAVSALRYHGMPLTHAFRQPVLVSYTMPQTIQMPPGNGIVITQVIGKWNTFDLIIAVNGVSERLMARDGNALQTAYDLNPPMVVRPGDSVILGSANGYSQDIVISGYTVAPGEI